MNRIIETLRIRQKEGGEIERNRIEKKKIYKELNVYKILIFLFNDSIHMFFYYTTFSFIYIYIAISRFIFSLWIYYGVCVFPFYYQTLIHWTTVSSHPSEVQALSSSVPHTQTIGTALASTPETTGHPPSFCQRLPFLPAYFRISCSFQFSFSATTEKLSAQPYELVPTTTMMMTKMRTKKRLMKPPPILPHSRSEVLRVSARYRK